VDPEPTFLQQIFRVGTREDWSGQKTKQPRRNLTDELRGRSMIGTLIPHHQIFQRLLPEIQCTVGFGQRSPTFCFAQRAKKSRIVI